MSGDNFGRDGKAETHAAHFCCHEGFKQPRLRGWRKERALSEEIAPFMIFCNATLELVAELKPRTPTALRAISGIGPEKLEKYGAEVLELVG